MIARILGVVVSVCVISAMAFSPALAVGEDVFVVPRVTVQAQGDSATVAKSSAQRAGRRRAMDILLRRLTVEDDWAYLPRLATGEPAQTSAPVVGQVPGQPYDAVDRGVITLSDRDLELLESGFEVYNEKSSAKTYRAYITYRFKPDAVRKILKDARIPYSEAQTRTALVLPVLQTSNGTYLWEENNPWMGAWKVRPYDNELTPMVAPLGDLEDAGTVSPRQALALNQAALGELAARYSVSQVIIAQGYLQQSDGQDKLRVRLINGYREVVNLDAVESELGDDTAYAGPSGSNSLRAALDNVVVAKVGDVLAEEWFSQPSGNFPALAERSIEVAIAKYAKPWKERTLIDHSSLALLGVSAYYRSLAEWAQIRSALVSTPLIGSVQVQSLSRFGAEILVQAYGDPSKLTVAMEAQGLALWSEDGDHWLIATPTTAQDVRGVNRRQRRNRFRADGDQSDFYPASIDETESVSGENSQY